MGQRKAVTKATATRYRAAPKNAKAVMVLPPNRVLVTATGAPAEGSFGTARK